MAGRDDDGRVIAMPLMIIILGAVAYAAISGALSGVAAMLLWQWFVVPLGVPALGFWHALGLATTIGLLTKDGHLYNRTDSADRLGHLVITALMAPILAVLFGWAYSGLMP